MYSKHHKHSIVKRKREGNFLKSIAELLPIDHSFNPRRAQKETQETFELVEEVTGDTPWCFYQPTPIAILIKVTIMMEINLLVPCK